MTTDQITIAAFYWRNATRENGINSDYIAKKLNVSEAVIWKNMDKIKKLAGKKSA